MRLIADCGATSGKWLIVDEKGARISSFTTGAVNPSVYTPEHIHRELEMACFKAGDGINEVEMYVAGVVGATAESLATEAAHIFGLPRGAVVVETDMVGACRYLLGERRGIMCILGTGSNSCLWSGTDIEQNIRPMGYILGDEGSGAALGAAILRLALRRLLPSALAKAWDDAYPTLTYPGVVEQVYRCHAGSGYIAGFVSFLAEHRDHPIITQLIDNEFERFFSSVISNYHGFGSLPLAFTGGVADTFSDRLRLVAEKYQCRLLSVGRSFAEVV